MTITARGNGFNERLAAEAPDEPGVFELSQYNIVTFIGSATASIREELTRHAKGEEGSCTTTATWVKFEVTPSDRAEAYAEELREEYRKAHGALPRCNDLDSWQPADPSGRRGGGGE